MRQLGSATLTTDASGNRVGELRYKPYGETRYIWGVMRTDRRFTGQREEAGLGLYDYGARYYDPLLGRFISADTIVPSPGNPQALNRYAYTLSNPLRYTDPSGHIENDPDELARAQEILDLLAGYGVVISRDWGWRMISEYDPWVWDPGAWELDELEIVRQAVEDTGARMGGTQEFRTLVGRTYVRRVHGKDLLRLYCEYVYPRVAPAALSTGKIVTLYDELFAGARPEVAIVHELGHAWDWTTWASESLRDFVGGEQEPTDYAMTNAQEHWAETVASWVYPDYLREQANREGRPQVLNPLHQQYMALAVSGQIPIPWWAKPPDLSIPEGSTLP